MWKKLPGGGSSCTILKKKTELHKKFIAIGRKSGTGNYSGTTHSE